MRSPRAWTLTGVTAALLAGGLLLPGAASAASIGASVPVALFGLPSLHSIIEAIANDFFGALAGALVPSWLKHGTVATIQHLVALPDPASWTHVSRLQGEMTYLGAMLLPVTLAVGATRYWLVGLTGSAHPASAVVRCAASSGVLVAYRWVVEQTVAAVNTLTHGILGLPQVAGGLARIIGVLFGGALLTGGGGVFGAFLVIVGVVFAAGLFAMQVLLTVALAVLVVAGPPLIALAAIPELSHLARGWADALLAVALVPLGWTVLFATAGALCLDATSFTGASGGLPGHIAAAFAGLITFVLAVRLPLMAVGEIRSVFSRHGLRTAASSPQGTANSLPGGERVRAAQGRLRAVGVQAVPSLGASIGRAAGALGAPAGGPIGAARRRTAAVSPRSRIFAAAGRSTASKHSEQARPQAVKGRSVRERLTRARGILAQAPAEAAAAMSTGRRRARNVAGAPPASNSASARARADATTGRRPSSGRQTPGSRSTAAGASGSAKPRADRRSPAAIRTPAAPGSRSEGAIAGGPRTVGQTASATGGRQTASGRPAPPRPPEMHPAGKLKATTRHEAPSTTPPSRADTRVPTPVAGHPKQPATKATPTRKRAPRAKTPATPPGTRKATRPSPRGVRRKPRPRGRP